MKTLYLLRHAKSSWTDAGLADFKRPLNERGLMAAALMGELMARNGYHPAVILSSPATRAKMTARLVKESGRLDAEIQFEERIYEASPHDLREVVSEIDDAHASTIIVGHNPGIESFIGYLTGQIEPVPTAALAVIAWTLTNGTLSTQGAARSKAFIALRIFIPNCRRL